MIGVLRDGAAERAPEPPQPTLADCPRSSRSRGRRGCGCAAAGCAAAAAVPARSGRTAYRVVQEGLTNARKHAPGAAVEVAVRRRRRGLVVEVVSRSAVGVGAAAPRAGGRRARASSASPSASRWPAASSRTDPTRRRLRPARDLALDGVSEHPRPARRRRRAGALGPADDAAGRRAHRGRRRGRRRPRRARARSTATARRRPHGHPHAGARRHRGDPPAALPARPPAVLVLTTFDADELVVGALRAGAAGFLLKDTPPAEIVRAIELVHAGDGMLSPAVTRRLIALVAGDADAGTRYESARERLAHAQLARARGRARRRRRASPTPRSPPSCT